MKWRDLLAAAALTGAASAQPASIEYVQIDVPAGWVRNDETRFASYSPGDDPNVVLMVATRLGQEGAEDALEEFIAHVEADESSLERSEPETLADTDFQVLRQTTRTRTRDGAVMSRVYVAADPGKRDTILVYGGTDEAFARHERAGVEAILNASFAANEEPATKPAAEIPELPGDGGLDGVFLSEEARPFLDALSGRWKLERRADLLVLDPLGEVYRGPAASLGPEMFDSCVGGTAWRCGRYRLEDGYLVLRWADGTSERRGLYKAPAGLSLGGVLYRAMAPSDAGAPAGAYVYQDNFNTGDWPVRVPKSGNAPLQVRFLEDGRFLFEGFTSIRNPRFGNGFLARGRYKIDGRSITLVYEKGGSDVVGYARWGTEEHDIVLIGGHAFSTDRK